MQTRDLPVEHHLSIGVDVAQKAQLPAGKGFDPKGVGLGDIAGALDLVVQHREHPTASGGRAGGQANGIQEVQVSICAHGCGRSHGPR